MKKMLILSFAVFCIFASIGFVNIHNLRADEQQDALTVLKVYFNALTQGDIETIRESLGGELVRKRLQLLSNPDYSEFLRDLYKDSRFKVLRYKTKQKDSIQIDVKIDINENEYQQMRYLLIKKATSQEPTPRFRICSQTELTGMLPDNGN